MTTHDQADTSLKITVHGSTGAQGGPVASALSSAGHQVLGMTRQAAPGDAAHVAADLENPASLTAAYANADAVFVHLPLPASPVDPERWASNVVTALADSGVRRVVFSTSGGSMTDAGPTPMSQAMLAGRQGFVDALNSAVDDVVVLAPRMFLENLLLPFVAGPAISDGVLAYPLAADKPISWISHLDVAKAAVAAFNNSAQPGAYDLGIDAILGQELADRIGDGIDAKLTYQAISPEEFTARATPLFGPEMAAGVGGLYASYAQDHTLAIPAESQQLGTADRMSVEEWAAQSFPRP